MTYTPHIIGVMKFINLISGMYKKRLFLYCRRRHLSDAVGAIA
jgi:hypothetical protein